MTPSRPRIRRARQGGPGGAAPFLAAALVAACLAAGVAAPAGAGPVAPPAPARGEAEAATPGAHRPALRVFPSEATVDTLDHPWREVFPAAIAALEHDGWAIQRADSSGRRIVTRWKPMDHLLTRLALGEVQARCVVDLAPLVSGGTEVTFRAGLASANDLEANPAYGAARLAYERAARRWVNRVHGALGRTAQAPELTR